MSKKIDLTGAQEVQASWFKFIEEGDGVKGTLHGYSFKKGEDGFQDQYIYRLEDDGGKMWNVGISASKKGTVERLNSVPDGNIVAIIFEQFGPKVKGKKRAKYLKVYDFGKDSRYHQLQEEADAEAKAKATAENGELPDM